MQNAAEICDAVKSVVYDGKTMKMAIDAYEEEMWPRGAKEVALSYETAKASRNWKTVSQNPTFSIGLAKPMDETKLVPKI